jgi:ABC-type multidrug transport system ATPase subunit
MDGRAVTLEHIKKTYRVGATRKRKAAVEDLSLEVGYGGIFGLLGPNGAGKTTTLKVILGIVFPEGGSGTLLGTPAWASCPSSRISTAFSPPRRGSRSTGSSSEWAIARSSAVPLS